MRAYLIENSSRIVEVGINGPREVLLMSLSPHQPENGSITMFLLEQDLQKLYGSAVRSISDSDEALNIFVTRLMGGRHRNSTANQVESQRVTISNSFSKFRNNKDRETFTLADRGGICRI